MRLAGLTDNRNVQDQLIAFAREWVAAAQRERRSDAGARIPARPRHRAAKKRAPPLRRGALQDERCGQCVGHVGQNEAGRCEGHLQRTRLASQGRGFVLVLLRWITNQLAPVRARSADQGAASTADAGGLSSRTSPWEGPVREYEFKLNLTGMCAWVRLMRLSPVQSPRRSSSQ